MKRHFQRLLHIIKNSFSAATVLLLVLIVCGCAMQTVVDRDYPLEIKTLPVTGYIGENDILSAIVQMNISTPDGYFPARAALIIRKPSYLRLEMLPVIGTPDFFLAASPDKMSIFIPSKRKLYYGRPTEANLSKFLPWKINIEEAVMIFSGMCPALNGKEISYRSFQERENLRVEMKTSSGRSQIIWLGENNRLQKIVRHDESGKAIYAVEYIYDETKQTVPEKIIVTVADGTTSLSVKFSDVKIEKATDLSIFDFPMPPDTDIIPMD